MQQEKLTQKQDENSGYARLGWVAGIMATFSMITVATAGCSVGNESLQCDSARTVTVDQGETAWKYAQGLANKYDVRDTRDALAAMAAANPGAKLGQLAAGQEINLPTECH